MKLISQGQLASALGALPKNPRVVATGSVCTPHELLNSVDACVEEYRLSVMNAQVGIPKRDGVSYETTFVGPGMRNQPVDYYPARLSLTPDMFSTTMVPDIVLLNCSPPRDGFVSLGLDVTIMPGAVRAAFAQINREMPYTYGDSEIPIELIDYAYEADAEIPAVNSAEPDELSRAIAERLASRIDDGASLQTGIGAVPDAVLKQLTNRHGLRIWTELGTDGIFALHQAGCLSDDVVTCSFVIGSRELYEWVADNRKVRLLDCKTTNDPAQISAQPAMVSINTALQVDLFGAANASRINNRTYSGTGGQTDFIVGAMHSPGGQAILALQSWHPKADASTIVGKLREATTSMQMSAVVTEYGVAELAGHTQAEQVRGLIAVAHPRARQALTTEALALGLISD